MDFQNFSQHYERHFIYWTPHQKLNLFKKISDFQYDFWKVSETMMGEFDRFSQLFFSDNQSGVVLSGVVKE